MPRILDVHHTGEFWRGAVFPIGKPGTPVEIVEDIDLVFSSLIQILNTRRGERIYYPEFGSGLGPILWEPHDEFLLQVIRTELNRSLSLWEPRVRLNALTFDINDRLRDLGIFIVSISVTLVNNPRQEAAIQVPISSQGTLFAG